MMIFSYVSHEMALCVALGVIMAVKTEAAFRKF
jgi:hypothetical protein